MDTLPCCKSWSVNRHKDTAVAPALFRAKFVAACRCVWLCVLQCEDCSMVWLLVQALPGLEVWRIQAGKVCHERVAGRTLLLLLRRELS